LVGTFGSIKNIGKRKRTKKEKRENVEKKRNLKKIEIKSNKNGFRFERR